MSFYKVLSGVFALLTFIFAFIVVSNTQDIYWSASTIAAVGGAIMSGIVLSVFWKWAHDLLEAIRDQSA
jgi:hypothetical protein